MHVLLQLDTIGEPSKLTVLGGSQPRVYELTKQEALEAVDVIVCMLYFFGCSLSIMFDMGASILFLGVYPSHDKRK